MIPLSDKNPSDSFPVVTILLIMINCLVFGYQMSLFYDSPRLLDQFIQSWGFIPVKLSSHAAGASLMSLVTSMFLHGGYLHLGGNMLYLWIFGDNIEDELGHFKFLFFYLLAGLSGSLTQYWLFPASEIPMIGASGAIAGVLGSYMLLYPQAQVLTAVIFIIFIRTIHLPAWILLGFWIFLQLFEGVASLGVTAGGGVAWFAHLGGFVAGAIMIIFHRTRELS